MDNYKHRDYRLRGRCDLENLNWHYIEKLYNAHELAVNADSNNRDGHHYFRCQEQEAYDWNDMLDLEAKTTPLTRSELSIEQFKIEGKI